jgi:hypothetical protein
MSLNSEMLPRRKLMSLFNEQFDDAGSGVAPTSPQSDSITVNQSAQAGFSVGTA